MSDQRRDDLVDAYSAAFDSWCDAVDGLDDAAWSTPTGCPGWDVHDQLAHVISVERRMLGDTEPRAEVADDVPYLRNDFGRFVEGGVQARRGVAPAELVEEARETFARRLEQLRALPPSYLDEQVDGPVPGVRLRGAQLLRTRIYDVTTHEYDVRRPLGRLDAPADGNVAISLELIVRGWSRVLPDVIEGSSVLAIVVDGAELARLHLGDGTLHRGADGPATDAVLGTSVAQLLAIAGGRSDAPVIDELDVQGDAEVVRSVLAADSITP